MKKGSKRIDSEEDLQEYDVTKVYDVHNYPLYDLSWIRTKNT